MADGGEIVYLGCYTGEAGGRGSGIVAARRDPVTGALDPLGTVAPTVSPSFLARHPTQPVLYAVNEVTEGTVSAWAIDADTALRPLGTWSTGGDSPCHLAVGAGGRHLFSANYGSGSVAVHPLDSAGVPGERTDLRAHDGHGPVPQRQERAHAHMVSPGPDNGSLLAVDLGTDTIYRYDLDALAGRLLPREPLTRTRPGTGPRHLARHPDRHRCYVAGELDASIVAYTMDSNGTLRERGRVAASARHGAVQPSEIAVRPDGRFLYVGNRGVGTVSVFALDEEVPRYVTEVATGGTWPRHFALIGTHLYVADERADVVSVFTVDPANGIPEPAGSVAVASPTCVLGPLPSVPVAGH
ncbi:lactonase family protein [Micromonospora sp. NBC_01699]|uniref:lactonase family protein n=1 Tax=Micromonospora sp. NBC_01699 TaxID=2975984 RepID=UPI002E287C45|nr:lactonase family protein [Micromonospora sp. NBC_01699]